MADMRRLKWIVSVLVVIIFIFIFLRFGNRVLVLDLDETLVHYSQAEDLVIERPHVHAFLRHVFNEFDYLAIFTAGTKDYASPIIDRLEKDAGMTFKKRFYRDSCTVIEPKPGSFIFAKDLRKLQEPLKGILLLDNTPSAYSLQPQCGVPIESFYGDARDVALLDIVYTLDSRRS